MTEQSPIRCIWCFEYAVSAGRCAGCGKSQAEPNRDRRALRAGAVVAGKYAIGAVLGSGTFGITYLAHDEPLGRRVALKEYFPTGLGSRAEDRTQVICNTGDDEALFKRGLDKFFKEGRILAQFNHPNIVTAYEVLQANGTAYLAMQYLDGQTLKTWLEKSGGTLPEDRALDVMMFICDALRAVHAKQVVHRDLKPDNVYVTTEGMMKLLDFGGAKQLTGGGDRSTDAFFANGYAPPEQHTADSARVGPWSDVYACGAVLYKLLTGITPPSSVERAAGMEALDWSKAKATPATRSAVERAMMLKPSDRFQTIKAYQDALASPGAVPKQASRSTMLPVLSAVVVVAALVAGWGAYHVASNRQTAPPPAAADAASAAASSAALAAAAASVPAPPIIAGSDASPGPEAAASRPVPRPPVEPVETPVQVAKPSSPSSHNRVTALKLPNPRRPLKSQGAREASPEPDTLPGKPTQEITTRSN